MQFDCTKVFNTGFLRLTIFEQMVCVAAPMTAKRPSGFQPETRIQTAPIVGHGVHGTWSAQRPCLLRYLYRAGLTFAGTFSLPVIDCISEDNFQLRPVADPPPQLRAA